MTYVPYLSSAGELKTKPTQHSVKELLNAGIQPDIIMCRSEKKIDKESIEKISLFCNVKKQSVIPALNANSIYEVPLDDSHENVIKFIGQMPQNTLIYAIGNQVGAGQELLNKIAEYRYHG